jgi:creatinine amidohydrolase
MTKRLHALQDLTFAEFEARLADKPVIVLPLGSQEEQGPHAPMGDYVLAEHIALAAAEKADAICAPVLPFGYAEFFRGKPGGIQLRAKTFCAVLSDMIEAFLDHGLEHIVICNGHSTNAPLIADVCHGLRRTRGVIVPNINLWRTVPDQVWQDLHGDNMQKARGHGADPVTSVAMHLTPDLMRMDLLQRQPRKQAFGLPIVNQFSGIHFEGSVIDVPLDVSAVAADGIGSGDPTLCNGEIGKGFARWLVGYVAQFITFFREQDPRASA